MWAEQRSATSVWAEQRSVTWGWNFGAFTAVTTCRRGYTCHEDVAVPKWGDSGGLHDAYMVTTKKRWTERRDARDMMAWSKVGQWKPTLDVPCGLGSGRKVVTSKTVPLEQKQVQMTYPALQWEGRLPATGARTCYSCGTAVDRSGRPFHASWCCDMASQGRRGRTAVTSWRRTHEVRRVLCLER